MTDEVHLGPEATEVAGRIRAVDADLDDLERRTADVNAFGLKGGWFGAWSAHRAEDRLDDRRARLTAERAELVVRLKRLDGDA